MKKSANLLLFIPFLIVGATAVGGDQKKRKVEHLEGNATFLSTNNNSSNNDNSPQPEANQDDNPVFNYWNHEKMPWGLKLAIVEQLAEGALIDKLQNLSSLARASKSDKKLVDEFVGLISFAHLDALAESGGLFTIVNAAQQLSQEQIELLLENRDQSLIRVIQNVDVGKLAKEGDLLSRIENLGLYASLSYSTLNKAYDHIKSYAATLNEEQIDKFFKNLDSKMYSTLKDSAHNLFLFLFSQQSEKFIGKLNECTLEKIEESAFGVGCEYRWYLNPYFKQLFTLPDSRLKEEYEDSSGQKRTFVGHILNQAFTGEFYPMLVDLIFKYNVEGHVKQLTVQTSDNGENMLTILQTSRVRDLGYSDKVLRDKIKEFIDNDEELNIENSDGHTPLTLACENGDIDTARILLGAGANATLGSPQDYVDEDQQELKKLLLDYGAREEDEQSGENEYF